MPRLTPSNGNKPAEVVPDVNPFDMLSRAQALGVLDARDLQSITSFIASLSTDPDNNQQKAFYDLMNELFSVDNLQTRLDALGKKEPLIRLATPIVMNWIRSFSKRD